MSHGKGELTLDDDEVAKTTQPDAERNLEEAFSLLEKI
jgi:hypothetical protein